MDQRPKINSFRAQLTQFFTRQPVQWGLLFVGLIVSLWAVTQSREAPQLILLGLLTIIILNFSLPPSAGGGGLAPIIVVSSWLILGWKTAVLLSGVSFVLAELSRTLWKAAWIETAENSTLWQRTGQFLVYLLPLIPANLIYTQMGGLSLFIDNAVENLAAFSGFIAVYGGVYFLLSLVYWLVLKRPYPQFFSNAAVSNIAYGFLALPVAILGSLSFHNNGLPAFIIFGLGVIVFSVLIRLSWQRRLTIDQRFAQFARLNEAGLTLRETLDLPTVLSRTKEQVLDLVPADKFDIFLGSEQNDFSDDFSRWVVEQGRTLDLDSSNMHFAQQHGLTSPKPLPSAWLGIPLMAAEQVIGVMVIQQWGSGRPFSQWNRELLLAMAGQASAAIQNARLYSRTDEALARRVEQLQALLNGMQEGVLMVDRHGRIPLINSFAATLLNQPTPGLHTQTLTPEYAALLGYTKVAWVEQLANLFAGKEPNPEPIVFMKKLAGKSRFILRQETAVRAATGQIMGWLMILRDITEEQELAEQRADLTRMIVHDLRNPLSTLLTALNLMPQSDEPLVIAQQSALDMLDMVDSLMDINQLEAGQLIVEVEAMWLPPLVKQVMSRLRPLADQKQITLQIDHPLDLPAIWGDAEILRRVLINLLDNGLKFTPAGGHVIGRFQPEPADANQEPGVRGIIQDTGSGIPTEYRELVFDRYMRTNPGGAQIRGTGLGLTFCKLAVEAHNGRIWVEDDPDGGSQFVFTLPGIPILETGD